MVTKKDQLKLDELTADLQRVQADFVNYKRRAEAEKAELLDYAKGRVIRDFLAVRDNFDRELANRPADINADWAKSIDQIRVGFDGVLKSLGVERFASAGHGFDPHLHEAVTMDEGEGSHAFVTDELQAGYKLGDQILRHAMVRVGHNNESDTELSDNQQGEQ